MPKKIYILWTMGLAHNCYKSLLLFNKNFESTARDKCPVTGQFHFLLCKPETKMHCRHITTEVQTLYYSLWMWKRMWLYSHRESDISPVSDLHFYAWNRCQADETYSQYTRIVVSLCIQLERIQLIVKVNVFCAWMVVKTWWVTEPPSKQPNKSTNK